MLATLPEHCTVLWAELLHRAVNRESCSLCAAEQALLPFPQFLAPPWSHGVLKHAEPRVGNNQFALNSQHGTKPFAGGAGALGSIEGEKSGRGVFKAQTFGLKSVGEVLNLFFAANPAGSLAFKKRGLYGIRCAGLPVFVAKSGWNTVYNEFYTQGIRVFVEPHNPLTRGPYPSITLAAQKVPKGLGLAVCHIERSRNQCEFPLRQRLKGLEYVRNAVPFYFRAAWSISASDASKKQLEVVLHLRSRSNRGARIARTHFLLDGNCWG